MLSGTHPALAPELSRHVSQQDLANNAQAMRRRIDAQYPDPEPGRLERVAQHLLKLPLIYTTLSDRVPVIRRDGITPSDRTLPLEESLGLGAYVRMGWGRSASGTEGRYYQAVSASLLLHPTTIVTRDDIARLTDADLLESFSDQDRRTERAVKEQYLGSMVTGKDWLDIAARKVLGHVTTSGGEPAPLRDLELGEIKHHGLVPSELLEQLYSDAIGADGLSQVGPPEAWPQEAPTPIELDHRLIRLGFMTRGFEAEMAVDVRDADAHPEMPAISVVLTNQARRIWSNILGNG